MALLNPLACWIDQRLYFFLLVLLAIIMTDENDSKVQKCFTLKKWNAIATWSWDVEQDTCAICRIHLMDTCLRCQTDAKQNECHLAWGECNHVFHNCCMSLWVKQNNRCPLCQTEWVVQRIGK